MSDYFAIADRDVNFPTPPPNEKRKILVVPVLEIQAPRFRVTRPVANNLFHDLSAKFLKIPPGVFSLKNREVFFGTIGLCLVEAKEDSCLLYTSPSPRDKRQSRMPSSA